MTVSQFQHLNNWQAVADFRKPLYVKENLRTNGHFMFSNSPLQDTSELKDFAFIPKSFPEWLGDHSFLQAHNVRFPYIAGAMANGISTVKMVQAMAKEEMLCFFGSAGLSYARVEAACQELRETLGTRFPWGVNLIHSPAEPELEMSVSELLIKYNVTKVSASAYMKLTLPLVRYALNGIRLDASGKIQRKNYVFAKISRPEVALQFLQPAPQNMVDELLKRKMITEEEWHLSRRVPVAEDISVESDSGGHTDNQPLASLFPVIADMRDQYVNQYQYERPVRVGAGGGIGTPHGVAAAFALGAAYVLTGSINQSCVESGLHDDGKALLAQAQVKDVKMAPAADMFEMGVEVQVLSRGSLFPLRAKKLYEWYKSYHSIGEMPESERKKLELQYFKCSIGEAWRQTCAYWQARKPEEIIKGEKDPHHQMALLFRSYLGQSSGWAIRGEQNRKPDYQIWCGPSMGAFNHWVQGTILQPLENRKVALVAKNMMEGAAYLTRLQQLRSVGVWVPQNLYQYKPQNLV